MIRWTQTLLDNLHPGRGVGPTPQEAKPKSATALWNGAVDGFRSKRRFLDGAPEHRPLQDRADALFATSGKAGANQDWDTEAFGLAWAVSMARKDSYTADKGGAYKLARYAVHRGGRQTIDALLFAGRVDLGFDCNWRGVISKRRLAIRQKPSFERPDHWRGATNPLDFALDELRLLFALADDAVYADAEAAAREAWSGLTPSAQAVLAFVLPTLSEEADALARSLHAAEWESWWGWLAQSVKSPDALLPLGPKAGWKAPEIYLPVAACEGGDRALLAWLEAHPDQSEYLLPALACVISPGVARALAAHPDDPSARDFFLAAPELALEHLPPGELLDEVLRTNPELNPDASPLADDAELPALFRRPVKGKLKDFEAWKVHSELQLRGSDKVLSPAQFEQLGKVLCKAQGRPLEADRQALRELLDPKESDAFSLALLEDYFSQGYYRSGKWALRSVMALGGDRTVDALAARVKDLQYPDQVAVVEILEGIGSEHSLIRLAHFAEKGRGRGFKNAAKAAMARIAHARGLNQGQLADRLVPTLGLDPSGRTVLDYGPRQFTVGFDEKLKPFVVDDKGKKRANLPKPGKSDDPEKAPAEEARWKLLKKDVRTLASTQLGRFETGMRTQRRWSADEFDRYLAGHPLVCHLARRVVWGVYSESNRLLCSFRLTDEGELVDAEDEAIERPPGRLGVVHPLELEPAALAAWGEVLADYEILQPFPQLGRATYPPGSPDSDAVLQQVDGHRMEGAYLFKLLNQGWTRGGVEDAGQWYDAWVSGPGFTLRVVTSYGVNISGGYGGDEVSDVQLKVRAEGPDPVRWSEAVHDLSLLLA